MIKVLIASNDEPTWEVFRKFIERKGYSVGIVHTDSDIITYVEKEKPRIILLIRGLGIEGFNVLKRVKEIDSSIKIIFVPWGDEYDEEIESAKELGTVTFLYKVFRLKEFEKLLLELSQNG